MGGHQLQSVNVDIIKSGPMQIEYNVIFKVYRKKYFIVKSDLKLYYFDSANDSHNKKPDGMIDLLQVTAMRKIENEIFEMRVSNKSNSDFIDIFTADTTIWRFKLNSMMARNEWFDCIQLIVSQNKNKKEQWCIVEEKEDGIYSNILLDEEHKGNDVMPSAPEQSGMNVVDNPENDAFIPPPAFAPGFGKEYDEGDSVQQYGDEGVLSKFQ